MPHPSEVVNELNEAAAEITSPNTSKAKRRELLSWYKEAVEWIYARINQIHSRLMNLICENPDVSFKELLANLSDLGLDEGELVIIESVYLGFHERRIARNQALLHLDLLVDQALAEIGEQLTDEIRTDFKARAFFAALTKSTPEGNITFADFPFAVGIRFDDINDIETFEGGNDVVADYVDDQVLNEGVGRFPLIALSPKSDESSGAHEEAHGFNASILSGLRDQGIEKEIWGEDTKDERGIVDRFGLDWASVDPNEIVESVMPWLMAKAKDEVIAFFTATDNFTQAITILWQYHVKKQGSSYKLEDTTAYDFFYFLGLNHEEFKSKSEARIFNQLVEKFNSTLIDNVGFLRRLWGAGLYDDSDRLNKETLLSFMRCTPLPLWQKMVRRAFPSEVKALLRVLPNLESDMSNWSQIVGYLDEEYFQVSHLPNGMTYKSFRGDSREGHFDKVHKISANGELLCQEADQMVDEIEERISRMKDMSLRHDLFDPTSLSQLRDEALLLIDRLARHMELISPHFQQVFRDIPEQLP